MSSLSTPHQPTTVRSARADAISGVDSSTFGEGLRLLPERVQADVRQLYSVLRTIDDLVDEDHPDAARRVEAIERWAAGEPPRTPETHVLFDLSRRYPLRPMSLLELCAGMRHDLTGATIEGEADLERYCQQAGGSVGTMLAGLLGTTHPQGSEKMAVLGRAMQRTNILRDIDEDRVNGRLYIAQTTIARFGPPEPGRREALMRDQIARADELYEQGMEVIPTLIDGREAMALATALYREILRQIEREGYGRKAGRAIVPDWRKRDLVAQHSGIERDGPRRVQTIESPRSPCMPDP